MEQIKQALVRCTNSRNWEDAVSMTFPSQFSIFPSKIKSLEKTLPITIVVGHWAQNGKYMEEHVNGKHHNVFIYDRNHEEPRDSMATSLKQQIISFDGQIVLDTTETGSPKGHLVIMRLDNFPGQMLHANPKLDFRSRLHGAHLKATSAN